MPGAARAGPRRRGQAGHRDDRQTRRPPSSTSIGSASSAAVRGIRPTAVLVGSVGKTVWGGLRVGWIRAERPLIRKLVGLRARRRPRHPDPRAAHRDRAAAGHAAHPRAPQGAAARRARPPRAAAGRPVPRVGGSARARRPHDLGQPRLARQLAARARGPQPRPADCRPDRASASTAPSNASCASRSATRPRRRRAPSTRSPWPGARCCGIRCPTPAISPTSSSPGARSVTRFTAE